MLMNPIFKLGSAEKCTDQNITVHKNATNVLLTFSLCLCWSISDLPSLLTTSLKCFQTRGVDDPLQTL